MFCVLLLPLVSQALNSGWKPIHAKGVEVVDFARHDLPPIQMGGRINDLTSGVHFDNLLQDTPDEMRPPSLIFFYGFESCPSADADLKFKEISETKLPSRERLMIARYDMDANPKRAWFKFTPEMDLAKRMNVTQCPSIVFVPRNCDGFTEWCTKETEDPLITQAGCDNFVDKCRTETYAMGTSSEKWENWVLRKVKEEGEPEISPVLGSYAETNKWMRERDETTNDNELRNYFLVEAFPAYTRNGFLAMDTPPQVQEFFESFWERKKKTSRRFEQWHSGSTQMGFHDVQTSFVSLDEEGRLRDKLANEVLKPIVEKWSGMKDLQLTSFYGIREYKKNSWLRGHIDRIDTHVLSITFVVDKINASDINQRLTREEAGKLPKWPLEVYAYDGNIYRHEHPPGTMILYESSKLVHGRPYKNLGPDHLGAFCHFKPTNKGVGEAAEWDKTANFARANQAKNTQRVAYRTKAIQEPTMPRFSKQRYGEGTGIDKKKTKEKRTNKALVVEFVNESNQDLDVAWVNTEREFVPQGSVGAMDSVKIETHAGHKFAWMTKSKKPMAYFTIEANTKVYKSPQLSQEEL